MCLRMTIKLKVAVSKPQRLLQPHKTVRLCPQTHASRLSREQARVRALWRQAASLRSTFTQLKTFTDR